MKPQAYVSGKMRGRRLAKKDRNFGSLAESSFEKSDPGYAATSIGLNMSSLKIDQPHRMGGSDRVAVLNFLRAGQCHIQDHPIEFTLCALPHNTRAACQSSAMTVVFSCRAIAESAASTAVCLRETLASFGRGQLVRHVVKVESTFIKFGVKKPIVASIWVVGRHFCQRLSVTFPAVSIPCCPSVKLSESCRKCLHNVGSSRTAASSKERYM